MSRVVEVSPERLDGWLERFAANNPGPEARQRISGREDFAHDPLGVLLIRRGGYAVGLARGAAFADSKVGTRHVQSRTAAGGWSQQRFARRRGNQADELVRAVTEHTLRILPSGSVEGLVVGGDKALVRAVLDMTLTSAACPLTDVIEDQTAQALEGLVGSYRVNWVWMPPWGPDKITDDGREMLRALGFNL